MKQDWSTMLWEGWTALTLCAAAALPPGSPWASAPGIVWPGLALAVGVPLAWGLWGVLDALPAALPPEQLLEPLPGLPEAVRQELTAASA